MTPFILFLAVAALITGMFWKMEPFSPTSQTTSQTLPNPILKSPPTPQTFPNTSLQTSKTPPTSQTSKPQRDVWDPFYIQSLERPRLSKEQIAFLTSQTVLDMSVLPIQEEVDEPPEDYDMEDKIRYKGVLFVKKGMEDVKKDDETQRVEALVAKVYEEEEEWEPVLQKTGNHTYEVSELRPRKKRSLPPEMQGTD